MLRKIGMMLALAGSLFAMHQAELNLNNYDVDAKLDLDMGQFNAAVAPETVFVGARYLYGSDQHNDRLLDEGHSLVDAHFLVQQRLGAVPALTLGMGAKLVFTSISGEEFTALPLGVVARYALPLGLPVPVFVGGELYYSPDVLSFNEAKNYLEYELSLDVMLIDRAGVTAGYRKIDTNFDLYKGDLIFNETWFVGVKFRF